MKWPVQKPIHKSKTGVLPCSWTPLRHVLKLQEYLATDFWWGDGGVAKTREIRVTTVQGLLLISVGAGGG